MLLSGKCYRGKDNVGVKEKVVFSRAWGKRLMEEGLRELGEKRY